MMYLKFDTSLITPAKLTWTHLTHKTKSTINSTACMIPGDS